MVFGYLICRHFPFGESEDRRRRAGTAGFLLASLVADVDVVTDWIYFAAINSSNSSISIPRWILVFQLVSCVLGTLAWLAVASDGWLLEGMRRMLYCQVKGRKFREGTRLSNGALPTLGILLEDVPQVIVTIMVQNYIMAGRTRLSTAAQLNLTLAVFDVLHKLAQVYDSRHDVMSASKDRFVHQMHTLRGHTAEVCSVAVDEAGRRLVSTSRDGTARVWSTATGTPRPNRRHQHTEKVYHAGWLDRYRMVTVSADHTARVWRKKRCVHTLRHDTLVLNLAVSPDKTSFLTASDDKTVRLWSTETYELLSIFNPCRASTLCFIDNQRFVVASFSTRAELWTLGNNNNDNNNINTNNRPTFTVDGHDDFVNVVIKLTSSSMFTSVSFLTGSRDKTIKQWNASTGEYLRTFGNSNIHRNNMSNGGGHTHSVDGLARISDTKFVSTSYDKTAKLWDVLTEACLYTYRGHDSHVNAAVYLPKQKAVATASHDRTIQMWTVGKYLDINDDDDDDDDNDNDDIDDDDDEEYNHDRGRTASITSSQQHSGRLEHDNGVRSAPLEYSARLSTLSPVIPDV